MQPIAFIFSIDFRVKQRCFFLCPCLIVCLIAGVNLPRNSIKEWWNTIGRTEHIYIKEF